MITIPGYHITEEIMEDHESSLYRAYSEKDRKNVIIKTRSETRLIGNKSPKELETSGENSVEGLVRIYRLEKYNGGTAIIMEDIGGIVLEKMIQNRFGSLKDHLDIAVKVTDTLGRLHGRRIIHGGINPSAIFVNPLTAEVKILDMACSRPYGPDASGIMDMELRTLMYISPEQTGRMNRVPDHRTDYYSLGVTLYEMLTGQSPFRSQDPVDLIYSHIARVPEPLTSISPRIPEVISGIVAKLLAKNPEDRYQSSFGIKHDLERCMRMLDAGGSIENFAIGRKDVSEWLNIPRKIYGRKKEKSALIEAYERIAHGASELVAVSGPAGIGKTSLIHDTFQPVLFEKAFFIEGKYDKLKQEIPYSAIIQAFRGLVRQLLTENREKLATWKADLQAAFGVNGQIILDVIPEVEFIVGPQPPMPALGPAEAKNVFDATFQAFFKVFTREEHPLVMFLDDLQNADTASLKLMETILIGSDCRFFLFIVAYRGDEVAAGHPLLETMENLMKARVRTERHVLESLGNDELGALTSDMFSSIMDTALPLTRLLMKKTGGNAFFVYEFINKIYREKLLRFDTGKGAWEWDLNMIDQLSVTDNVIDLLIERLNHQPDEVREILSLASCVGNTFHASLLTEVRKAPIQETISLLLAAVREGFLLPARDLHDLEGTQEEPGSFKFLHDRIQEAAYALIAAGDIREVHLAIGRAIMKNMKPGEPDDRIFEILTQFGKGIDLVTDESERLSIASLGLTAGNKASSATAYAQACGFLSIGLDALPENAWERNYKLTFDLHSKLSECEFLAGSIEESEQLFKLVMDKAATDVDRGEISATRTALYSNAGRFAEAQDIAIGALKLLGMAIDVRPDSLPAQIEADLSEAQKNLGDKKVEDLIDLPPMEGAPGKIIMKILLELTVPTYFSNQALFPLAILKMVNYSFLHGNSPESSYGYVFYGLILCLRLNRYEQAYEFGTMGIRLHETIGNRALDSKVYFLFSCFVNHWKRHAQTSIPLLEKAYLSGREYGDFNFSSFASGVSIINQLVLGRRSLEDLLEGCDDNIAFLAKVKNVAWHARQRLTRQIILSLLNRTDATGSFSTHDYDEGAELDKLREIKFLTGVAHYYLNKSRVLYIFGKYGEALAASDESEKLVAFHSSTLLVTDHYLYQSLICAALYPSATEQDRERFSGLLERNKKMFERWMNSCPENFECRYLLIAAESERIAGNDIGAMRLYDRAISSAGANQHVIIAAHANERAAAFHRAGQREKIACVYLEDAVRAYAEWGIRKQGTGRERPYPEDVAGHLDAGAAIEKKKARVPNAGYGHAGLTSVTDMIDLASIMKSSMAISGEMLFENLVDKLMKILLENAGAQSGLLLIEVSMEIIVSARHGDGGISVTMNPAQDQPPGAYPESVVNYVKRTGESVVLNDAAAEGMFVTDPYIAGNRPQSILCMPIVEQKKLTGILYLENRMVKNVFTPERIEILKLLSSQAAISVRNSLTYEELSRTKEQLEVTLNEYLNLFNNIQDAFYRTNMEGRIILVSPSAEKLLGYTVDECLQFNLADLYRYPDQRNTILDHLKKEGIIEDFETQLVKKDGSVIWVSSNSHYYRDKIGRILGVEGIVRDITKRKEAESSLRDSLEQKEILLKELYHRTKNNMQVISSLLSLRSAGIKDSASRDVFADMQTKIKTMALVHQKLYEANDLSNINVRDFTAGIVGLIIDNVEFHKREIAIHQSIEDIHISIDTAVPLGLVINELVTNSIKHAFADGRRGEIRLQSHRSGEDIIFEYHDNGNGLPDGFNPEKASTLGMMLITSIIKRQLGGSITFSCEKGFGCRIAFNSRLYEKRL